MDSWVDLEEKLIQFGKIEAQTRPAVRKVLNDLEKDHTDEIAYPQGQHTLHKVNRMNLCLT